eukprot:6491043-Amphidinium_carterae.1
MGRPTVGTEACKAGRHLGQAGPNRLPMSLWQTEHWIKWRCCKKSWGTSPCKRPVLCSSRWWRMLWSEVHPGA